MKFINNIQAFILIIGKKKKYSFVFLIFLLILQSILEVLGIALVIPILNYLLKEDISMISEFLPFLDNSAITSKDNIIIFALLSMSIFFLFKNFFMFKVVQSNYNFAANIQTSIRNKIFSNYLNMNYSDLSNIKSSNLISNLSVNCSLLTQTFTVPLLIFLSESMILISIMIFLVFFHPSSFLILLIFLLLLVFFYLFFISEKLKKLGIDKQLYEDLQIKTVENAIGSIKISKIFNIQKILFKNFSIFNKITSDALSKLGWISSVPRIILEIIGFLGLSAIIISLVLANQDYDTIIITISIFGVSAVKIIPSTNRIMAAIQSLNFSESILKTLIKNIKTLDKKPVIKKLNKETIKIKKNIILKDVTFSYPNSKKNLMNGLNFNLKIGKNIGIMGDSGIGKSTFLDILLGLIKIDRGKIIIDGKIVDKNKQNWILNFSYVGQENHMFDDSLLKNITLTEKKINKFNLKKINKILEILKLDSLINNNPDGINMNIGEKGVQLSGGQVQRIALARAIYLDRPIIIMDEPTSALDTDVEKYLFDNIHLVTKSTLIIVSHKLKTFQKADIIYKFLEGGKFKKLKKSFKKV
jgi:ATP-binding cassette, subfamily B, bacterial PglK